MVRPVGLAPYATSPRESRGRLHPEPEHEMRSPFQRDRDRIIHSTAFRRLKHKTQVFVYHEGDHYRTRLTHSLEVAQIARTICRALGLDEDLAEAVALAHDLGHTPFGHAGEEALNAAMKPIRRLRPQRPDAAHPDQARAALRRVRRAQPHLGDARRRGQAQRPAARTGHRPAGAAVDRRIHRATTIWSSTPMPGRGAGRRARRRHRLQQPRHRRRAARRPVRDRRSRRAAAGRRDVPTVARAYPGIAQPRLIHEAIRRMIDPMVGDMMAETGARLADSRAEIGRRHPRAGRAGRRLLRRDARQRPRAQGVPLQAHVRALPRQPHELKGAPRGARSVRALLRRARMPAGRVARRSRPVPTSRRPARVAADYIAGMTDRYALDEHHRLFDTYVPT